MTDFAAAAYGVRDRVLEAKGRKAEVKPQHKLRASGFWECDRNLYYQVANWQDRVPPTAEKQSIYDEGHVQEAATLDDLREAGYTIEAQQVSVPLKLRSGRTLTGHIDGMISGHDIKTPVLLEVKAYSFGVEKYKGWRDMQKAKQPWIKAVPNQLQLYLLQTNSPEGLLVLRSKVSAQLYTFPVDLDYDFAEGLMARAEHVYDCLEMEEPPKPAPYDSNLCGACDWVHICRPFLQVKVSSSGQIFDEAMEATAVEYLATLQDSKLNKTVGDELKAWAKGIAAEHKLTEIVLGEVAVLKVNATEKRTVVKILPQEDE